MTVTIGPMQPDPAAALTALPEPAPAAVLAVALGGAAGALARFALAALAHRLAPDLPLGTLAVNTLGCCLAGFLAGALALRPDAAHHLVRPALAIGFLGALTTFSAFASETLALARDGRYALAAGAVLANNALALAAAALGWLVAARALAPAP